MKEGGARVNPSDSNSPPVSGLSGIQTQSLCTKKTTAEEQRRDSQSTLRVFKKIFHVKYKILESTALAKRQLRRHIG